MTNVKQRTFIPVSYPCNSAAPIHRGQAVFALLKHKRGAAFVDSVRVVTTIPTNTKMKGRLMKKWLIAMLGAAAMTVSAGALAQGNTPGWYVGAEIGQVDFGDEDDTGWKILGGYQVNRTFAAEVGYGALFDKEGVEVTAWELVGVAKFPINNQFSIYGKLGFAMWDVDAGAAGSDDGTDLTYGIGVQYDLTPRFGIRAQWQRYDTDPEEADALTIGVIYRF